MPYSHILLDLDHTLLDTDHSLALAFEQAMRSVDTDPSGQYELFNEINSALWRKVEAQELTPPQVHVTRFVQLAERLELDADPLVMADAFAYGMGIHGDLFEGARQVLDSLSASSTLALVTNGLSDIQLARIARLELDPYFDTITISAEVGCAKPGTEIFDITFDALGGPERSKALMVGDNMGSDILGGQNAGVDTCWYNPHQAELNGEQPATYEIANLQDLVGIALGD